MYTVLLVIHSIVVLFLIGIILIQKPDADGLGGLGGGGNVFSGRAMGNMITRTTAILATVFIISSLTLGILSGSARKASITDQISAEAVEVPAEAPVESKKKQPSVPKPE